MEYLVRIKDTREAVSLINYLKSIEFVTVLDKKLNNQKEPIDPDEFKEIIRSAEKSRSIPLIEAIEVSEQWKNQRK